MATDDVQRLVTGSASAPAQFAIPGNGQIRPKAIFASFDGTGAAGAFLPALKIVSDGGETVGIYPCDTSVAAGASADVSWFPRLASAGGSSGSTAAAVAYCVGDTPTINSGANRRVEFSSFNTTDTTVFGTDVASNASPPYNNSVGDTYLYGHALGFYLAYGKTGWTASSAIATQLTDTGNQWDLNILGSVAEPFEVVPSTTPAGGTIGPDSFRMFYVGSGALPLTTALLCTNNDVAAHQVTGATIAVYYLGAPTTLLGSIY